MGTRYNEQTRRNEYVSDPIDARLPDAKAAAQYGYHSFVRGGDGKIATAIDPSTGQRVNFQGGLPPEMARTTSASTSPQAPVSDTGGPISSAAVALAKPTAASVALSRAGTSPAAGRTNAPQTGTVQAGTTQAGNAKTRTVTSGFDMNNPAATNTVPASSLSAPSAGGSAPSTTFVASVPAQRPSIASGFDTLPADVAQTVLAQRVAPRAGLITQGFNNPALAPASSPGAYASGGNFNTARATDDYATGKIGAAQLSQVYEQAGEAGDRQGGGISPATQAEMRGTASVGQQLQASQDAQAAANTASRRQPGGSPYGMVPVDPSQQGQTYVGDGKITFNGQVLPAGQTLTLLPGGKKIYGQAPAASSSAANTAAAGPNANSPAATASSVTSPGVTPTTASITAGFNAPAFQNQDFNRESATGPIAQAAQAKLASAPVVPTMEPPSAPSSAPSAGTSAGLAVRSGIGSAVGAIRGGGSNAVDSTLGAVGSGLSNTADFARTVVGLPPTTPAASQTAPVDAVNSYAANNPGVASQVKAPGTTSSGNIVGGYDLSGYNFKPPGTTPAAPSTPAVPATNAAATGSLSSATPASSPFDNSTASYRSLSAGSSSAATESLSSSAPTPAPLTGEDAIQQAAIDRNARLGRPATPTTGGAPAAQSSASPSGAPTASTTAQTLTNAPGYGADPASRSAQPAPLGKSALYQPGQITAGFNAPAPGSSTPAAGAGGQQNGSPNAAPKTINAGVGAAGTLQGQGYRNIDLGNNGVPVAGTNADGQRVDLSGGPSTAAGQTLNKAADPSQALNAAPTAGQALANAPTASQTLARPGQQTDTGGPVSDAFSTLNRRTDADQALNPAAPSTSSKPSITDGFNIGSTGSTGADGSFGAAKPFTLQGTAGGSAPSASPVSKITDGFNAPSTNSVSGVGAQSAPNGAQQLAQQSAQVDRDAAQAAATLGASTDEEDERFKREAAAAAAASKRNAGFT